MNLYSLLENQKNNLDTALKDKKCEISYSLLWARSLYVANIVDDDSSICAILIRNSIEFVISLFAVFMQGKTALLIKPDSQAQEISSIIKKCNITQLYTSSEYSNLISSNNNFNINITYVDKISYPEKINSTSLEAKLIPCTHSNNDVAVIIPTSGTTTSKKLVPLTHKNIYSNIVSLKRIYNTKNGDKDLLLLPLTSSFGLTVVLFVCLYSGMCVVIYDDIFSPKKIYQTLISEKIDYFSTTPSILKSLCFWLNSKKALIKNIKRISLGGEKASLNEMNYFFATLPNTKILYGYGMTECSPVIATKTLDDYQRNLLSVGKALPGVSIKIIDGSGRAQNIFQTGEILVSGSNIMKGYYASTESIIHGNWLHTGDIGYLDQEGYLYITGRKKNIIISSGQNIYPEEIEAIILDSGLVTEVRVRGIADKIIGEIIIADIVPVLQEAEITKLRKYCLSNLPTHKIPKKYVFYDKLDKTDTNKIIRS